MCWCMWSNIAQVNKTFRLVENPIWLPKGCGFYWKQNYDWLKSNMVAKGVWLLLKAAFWLVENPIWLSKGCGFYWKQNYDWLKIQYGCQRGVASTKSSILIGWKSNIVAKRVWLLLKAAFWLVENPIWLPKGCGFYWKQHSDWLKIQYGCQRGVASTESSILIGWKSKMAAKGVWLLLKAAFWLVDFKFPAKKKHSDWLASQDDWQVGVAPPPPRPGLKHTVLYYLQF